MTRKCSAAGGEVKSALKGSRSATTLRRMANNARPDVPWWRGRGMKCALAGLLLVIAVRLAWGWYAERALRAEEAAVRARGEPARVEDWKVRQPAGCGERARLSDEGDGADPGGGMRRRRRAT
jgi:hypothetical protein